MTRYFGRMNYAKERRKQKQPKVSGYAQHNLDKIICIGEFEDKKSIMLLNQKDIFDWRSKGLIVREANQIECTELLEKILSGFPCYSLLSAAR